MKNNSMNDKKRSLRMRSFTDSLYLKGFGGMKFSFLISPPLNFSNRTITAFDLQGKTNFKNAIFIGSILNSVTFKDIDLTGANFLKATLNSVTFDNCNLTKATFSSAKLNENTRFINKCILSNSFFFETELYGVNFESCTLTGVDFSGANLYTKIKDSQYIYTSFVNIDKFDNAVFKKAKLYGVAFKNCNLTKADFSEAELTFISYGDGDEYTEEHTVFDKVNLKEANFTSAILDMVSFKKNVNLRKANFTKAQLSNLYTSDFNVYLEDTLFVGANMKEVNFLYANYLGDPEDEDYDPKKEEEDIEYRYDYDGVKIISGLDFSDATLEDVNLAYSIFEEVNFSRANLLNVDFANSDLAHSNFSRAILETNNSVNLKNIIFDNADLSGAKITNEFFFNTSFYGANLENVLFDKCWFKNLLFNISTFFGGDDTIDDTRTEFIGCYVYIDDGELIYETKPYQYFLRKVFIVDSFINDDYYNYI